MLNAILANQHNPSHPSLDNALMHFRVDSEVSQTVDAPYNKLLTDPLFLFLSQDYYFYNDDTGVVYCLGTRNCEDFELRDSLVDKYIIRILQTYVPFLSPLPVKQKACESLAGC
jgi:hypothetical protein